MDGKRMQMPINGVTQYRGYQLESCLDASMGMNGPITRPFTYDIRHLRENGSVFRVALWPALRNPLEALVKGYRYHRKKKRRY